MFHRHQTCSSPTLCDGVSETGPPDDDIWLPEDASLCEIRKSLRGYHSFLAERREAQTARGRGENEALDSATLEDSEDDTGEIDDVCGVCETYEAYPTMILCDNALCNKSFHLECLHMR